MESLIMGKIEDLLMPDEQITKKQATVQLLVGQGGMPSGDLYLTNKRLIFLVSRGWSLVTPGAGIGATDVLLSLQDVKSIDKSLGYIKIKADKEYAFSVSIWHTGGWVNAVRQAIALYPPPTSQTASTPPPGPSIGQVRQPAQPSARRFCPSCGSPVSSEARFCESCGGRLQ
jgi:hypothetical protein